MVSRDWRTAVVIGLFTVLAVGCGGPNKYVVRGAQIAAGADANITVGDYENGNAQVEIEVANLPPANRVQSDATVFVVWFQPEDGQPAKAGQLAYDEDERGGTMTATSANQQFTVLITAESEGDVSTPSEHVVFRQAVSVP